MFTDYFLQCCLSFLSYFVPKDKQLLVFGCGNRREFQGHPKYLYLYLHTKQHDKAWKYCWSTEDKSLYLTLNSQNYPVIYKYSFRGFITLLRAWLFIHEKSSKDVYYIDQIVGRFSFFQTFHGTPLKLIGLDRIKYLKRGFFYKIARSPVRYQWAKRLKLFSMHKYKAMLACSDEVQKIYQQAFDHDNVLCLGYPRNDVFFDQSLLFQNLYKTLRLDQYERVILYAPTFRDRSSSTPPFSKGFLERLNELCQKTNSIFLLKKHPWEQSLSFPSHLSYLSDVSDQVSDIQELLVHTDVLVTDYSSVFFDFMVTGNPVVFYAYDLAEYLAQSRGMYYDYEQEVQGPIAKHENELLILLHTIEDWSEQSLYRERYHKVNAKFNIHNDGKACERVLAAIESIN